MTVNINKKITGFRVVDNKNESNDAKDSVDIIQMNETLARPNMLLGSTYKLKTPLTDDAMYVTINDLVLNEGTEHQQRRPFEIFINSKNMDHFQWIVALTRIMSAVFRKGGDVTFLVEELRSVFDPRGGYFKKGGKYMPSLVGEIGDCVESHLKMIGMIADEEMDDNQRQFLEEKLKEYNNTAKKTESTDDDSDDKYPAGSRLCPGCNTKAVIKMDGCDTCLSCGSSKCQ